MNSRIYTRQGDSGETSLVGGFCVRKDCHRVSAYGSLDEANSFIGLARVAVCSHTKAPVAEESFLDSVLGFVQQRLFNCSSNLATPPSPSSSHTPGVSREDVAALEGWIDHMTERTGAFPGFTLPAGCEAAVRLHAARTVVRRAERDILTLSATEPVDETILAFVNRLSDLLFAAARDANVIAGIGDTLWDPNAEIPTP